MGQPIPYDYRLKIVNRMKAGAKSKDLAQEYGYSESGVKKIWYRYKKEGEKGLELKYRNCGRKSVYSPEMRKLVNTLRDNNQGGDYIHSKLKLLQQNQQNQQNQQFSTLNMVRDIDLEKIPCARTLQRWWQSTEENRANHRPTNSEKKAGPILHMTHGK